jgi:hypothetical protein
VHRQRQSMTCAVICAGNRQCHMLSFLALTREASGGLLLYAVALLTGFRAAERQTRHCCSCRPRCWMRRCTRPT